MGRSGCKEFERDGLAGEGLQARGGGRCTSCVLCVRQWAWAVSVSDSIYFIDA